MSRRMMWITGGTIVVVLCLIYGLRSGSKAVSTATPATPIADNIKKLKDKDPEVVKAARLELMKNDKAAVKEIVEKSLTSDDVETRREAERVLSMIGGEETRTQMKEALSSPVASVKVSAGNVLIRSNPELALEYASQAYSVANTANVKADTANTNASTAVATANAASATAKAADAKADAATVAANAAKEESAAAMKAVEDLRTKVRAAIIAENVAIEDAKKLATEANEAAKKALEAATALGPTAKTAETAKTWAEAAWAKAEQAVKDAKEESAKRAALERRLDAVEKTAKTPPVKAVSYSAPLPPSAPISSAHDVCPTYGCRRYR